MTALEEIKKALEGVTPGPWFEGDKWVFVSPRSGLMNEALENVLRNDEAQANARYIAAVNPAAISELLSTLESLQRENEELRNGPPITGKWKDDERAKVWEYAFNKQHTRAEAAEAKVKRYREALIAAKTRMRNCRGAIESDQVVDKDVHGSLQNGIRDIQEALASTGGEHHAE